MSATLSGLFVFESPRQVEDSPASVLFDSQMWLGQGHILNGVFRYYNSDNMSFPDIGKYFAWVHIAKFVPQLGTGDQLNPASDNSDGNQNMDDADVIHVVGDIVQLIHSDVDEPVGCAYINISGVAVNCNKEEGTFDMKTNQYTTHYKAQRGASVLPVRAHFESLKYRSKKPMPSENGYVAVEGFLTHVDTIGAGATLFHISVDNISFLGRQTKPPPSSDSPSSHSKFKFKFGMSEESKCNGSASQEGAACSSQSVPSSSTLSYESPQSEDGMVTRTGKKRK